MLISHNSPQASPRRIAQRQRNITAGFVWDSRPWQTRPEDLANIAGRVAKLTALLVLGDIQLTDTQYTDSKGVTRPLFWRDTNNQPRNFTVQEFLRFGIAVDEFVEDQYLNSWS